MDIFNVIDLYRQGHRASWIKTNLSSSLISDNQYSLNRTLNKKTITFHKTS